MDSSEVVQDCSPYFKVCKDGHVERLQGTEIVPPCDDPKSGVQSKDIIISPATGVSARIFIPKLSGKHHKHPLLIHFHGGAFCTYSAFSPLCHNYCTSLVAMANIMIISINYRLAPENPLPIAYEDSWKSFKWVTSHAHGGGRGARGDEKWLIDHADFKKVHVAGESAGANIAHYVAMQAGVNGLDGVQILGTVLVHPYFHSGQRARILSYIYPSTDKGNDPRLNPMLDLNLSRLGCRKVLVCVAEKDRWKDRGCCYYEVWRKSGWNGGVKLFETPGEEHMFHLFNPSSEKAQELLKLVISFIN